MYEYSVKNSENLRKICYFSPNLQQKNVINFNGNRCSVNIFRFPQFFKQSTRKIKNITFSVHSVLLIKIEVDNWRKSPGRIISLRQENSVKLVRI